MYEIWTENVNPYDPSISNVAQLVSTNANYRPNIAPFLTGSETDSQREYMVLMQQCWAQEAHFRPTALQVKAQITKCLSL